MKVSIDFTKAHTFFAPWEGLIPLSVMGGRGIWSFLEATASQRKEMSLLRNTDKLSFVWSLILYTKHNKPHILFANS